MTNRQLAAIMFTDIVGYTALMGSDDKKALAILKKNRTLQKPIIEEFNGRWIKELGDGVMASFGTAADAVYAAVKIQETCNASKEFQLKIGIHLGDVLFENDDVFGDGVNIAARIQAAAAPGCIFISETVHHNISNKSEIKSQFVKEEKLKNVSQPVRMYQVLFAGSEIIAPETPATVVIENSIAVLPFANMSSDPEQEYFSDGISEEIINMLAQVPELKVIGRTSSFAFKGKNLDLKIIGEQLKVTHLLEGSVRKSGSKLRVTAQLISVADGFHLYSEKFDRELEDVFAIQDELSLAILNAIKIKLFGINKEAVLKKYTENVEAYELYLQGRFHMNKFTPDGFFKAIEYFDAAIAIDSTYALAFADKAFCYMNLQAFGWQTGERITSQAVEGARQAIQLDDKIAESQLAIGRIKLHWDWKISEAKKNFENALAINPNNAQAHIQLGFCNMYLGNDETAIEHARIGERLDPFSLLNRFYIGGIQTYTQHFDEMLKNGNKMIDLEPNFPGGYLIYGAALANKGLVKEAILEYEKAVKLQNSTYSLSHLGCIYGIMGEKAKAMEVIEQMKSIGETGQGGFHLFGNVYASIKDLDSAFAYYDKAVEGRESFMLLIKMLVRDVPEFWKDPRAGLLLQKIGLPNN
ncbi:MAG: AraC family transcriptional regulator [Cyclobacteriaceae bacterium]|nr:AraC family transcriptional regulator [Cyclobacteriaceae bacterium]MDH5251325.1 AraC family transcriptional regulator [Cyclobacteriaceae bacterium]